MPESAADEPGDGRAPGLAELFLGFSGIAVMGFGGVLPWACRMLVEERRWMSGDEFTELLALCQFMPGGNIINLAIVFGQRRRGVGGAFACVAGLMAAPTVLVLLLGSLYAHYGELQAVQGALAGIAAGAAGLILAMAARMAEPLFRRTAVPSLAVAVAAFGGVAVLHLPLPVVVLVLAPLSVAVAWRSAR